MTEPLPDLIMSEHSAGQVPQPYPGWPGVRSRVTWPWCLLHVPFISRQAVAVRISCCSGPPHGGGGGGGWSLREEEEKGGGGGQEGAVGVGRGLVGGQGWVEGGVEAGRATLADAQTAANTFNGGRGRTKLIISVMTEPVEPRRNPGA